MSRKAILIGSPTSKNAPYLKGVEKDLSNIKFFLMSANGGGWKPSEIVQLGLDPSFDEVEQHLNSLKHFDYSFVYYSGHGFTDVDTNKGRINLNIKESPFIEQIANSGGKQLTIIDACRGYSEYVGFEGINENYFSSKNIESARLLFDEYIKKCSIGKALMYSSQKGQDSFDSEAGGYFTTNLLTVVGHLVTKSERPIIDVITAYNSVSELTKNKQHPNLECTSSRVQNFPFAISSNLDFETEGIKAGDVFKTILATAAIVGAAVLITELLSGGSNKK